MNLQTRRVTWTSVGLVLAMTAGMPVIADDTELMLSTPDTGGKPNILFILSSSCRCPVAGASGGRGAIEVHQRPHPVSRDVGARVEPRIAMQEGP